MVSQVTTITHVNKKVESVLLALRSVGASILHLSRLGYANPILFVGFHNMDYLIIVNLSGASLSDSELDLLSHWHGKVNVVNTPEQALNVLGY